MVVASVTTQYTSRKSKDGPKVNAVMLNLRNVAVANSDIFIADDWLHEQLRFWFINERIKK